jgi:hypothetical protein
MDIRSFMLVTGQELVATLIEATGYGYRISKPLVLHVMNSPDGKGMLAFAKWSMIHADEEFHLLDHALLGKPVPVITEVEDSYLQNTSSLILAKPNGSLLQG